MISDINDGQKTFSSIYGDFKGNFAHSDYWNLLGFLFLAATIMIIHSIVDHFLLHKLNRFYTGKFYLDGLLWTGKRLLSLMFTVLLFLFMSNLIVDFYTNMRIASDTEDIFGGQTYRTTSRDQ